MALLWFKWVQLNVKLRTNPIRRRRRTGTWPNTPRGATPSLSCPSLPRLADLCHLLVPDTGGLKTGVQVSTEAGYVLIGAVPSLGNDVKRGGSHVIIRILKPLRQLPQLLFEVDHGSLSIGIAVAVGDGGRHVRVDIKLNDFKEGVVDIPLDSRATVRLPANDRQVTTVDDSNLARRRLIKDVLRAQVQQYVSLGVEHLFQVQQPVMYGKQTLAALKTTLAALIAAMGKARKGSVPSQWAHP